MDDIPKMEIQCVDGVRRPQVGGDGWGDAVMGLCVWPVLGWQPCRLERPVHCSSPCSDLLEVPAFHSSTYAMQRSWA